MNSMHNDKEHLLDLLVDGELSEAQRRELLLWCERDPEGWRRCALAFLEAQSWSQELAGFDPDSLLAIGRQGGELQTNLPHDQSEPNLRPASESDAGRQLAGRGAPRWRVVGWPLAMAASFLVSFALGLWARGGWLNSSSDDSQPAPANMPANMIAKQDLIDRLRQESTSREAPQAPVRSTRPQESLGQVRLVVDGPNGRSDEIELPVVEGIAADADFVQSPPAALPLEVQRVLERMGARVQQQRELVPLRMQDGRRLIVPVDKVEVHPVGNRAYQ